MEKKKKRLFTKEYRAEAVKLVIEQKQTVAQGARDLGISESCLSKWVRQAKIDKGAGTPGALTTEERAELAKLRRAAEQTLRGIQVGTYE